MWSNIWWWLFSIPFLPSFSFFVLVKEKNICYEKKEYIVMPWE
jgi:hypothetical protein